MPRKRKSDQSTIAPETATTSATIELEPAPQVALEPAPIVEEKPTFAERVGRKTERSKLPDPFVVAGDYVAGVRLFENRQSRQMAIKFDDRPSQPVIDKLKDAGYRWNSSDRQWVHPVRNESAMATRIEAERLYQVVRQVVRQDKGLETGQEIPF